MEKDINQLAQLIADDTKGKIAYQEADLGTPIYRTDIINVLDDIESYKLCTWDKVKDFIKSKYSEKLFFISHKEDEIMGKPQLIGDTKKRIVLSPIKYIKGNEKFVCLAMDCYYKGLSYRDIADQFNQFYGLKLHHETIRRWILRFSKVMEKYSKTLTPKTSGVWNADETLILTKRGQDKKNPNTNYDYVWNCMDNKTKFLLASINSGRSRSSKDAQNVFTEAWKVNKKMPNQIIVDGYRGYEDGCRKTFRNWGNERKVKFTSIKGHRKEINNNAIENHHTQQKEFQKVRKGVTEVQNYQDGFKVFHNFIRKGVKDKLTPAERCGIGVNGNRWNTLLLNSINNEKI